MHIRKKLFTVMVLSVALLLAVFTVACGEQRKNQSTTNSSLTTSSSENISSSPEQSTSLSENSANSYTNSSNLANSSANSSSTQNSYATDISITGYKTTFNNGEAFSSDGLTVTAYYSDNTSNILTSSQYSVDSSNYSQFVAGTYSISVTALGFTKTYQVTVGNVYVFDISITGYKTTFNNGEAFSSDGLTVTAYYSDNTSNILTSSQYSVDSSNYSQFVAGTYSISVTALGFTKTYQVTVDTPYALSINVSGAKTSFDYNQTFSTSGLTVTAQMSDNSTKTLTANEYTVDYSAYDKTVSGTYTITVSYSTLTATYNVTVDKDYSFTINPVTVSYNGTATISPNFTVTANTQTVTYTITSGSGNITISGNTVTGIVADSTATVTATSAKGTIATFTVTVEPDYTFTVANITTYQNFYEIPTPVFTVPANAQTVTYSTTSSNVTISDNKITGAVENSTATITATSAKGTTATFNVTVGSNNFFNNVFNTSSFLSYFSTLQTNLTNNTSVDKNDLTLYIGDSFFDTRNFFTTAFNTMYTGANVDSWGISSSMADQWIYFIQKAYSFNPKNLVIHIGTNDIFDRYGSSGKNLLSSATNGSTNYNTIVNNVTDVLKDLFNKIHTNLPDTTVYWYSIEPRTASSDTNGNAIAVAVNSNVNTFATSNSSWLKYLDSYTPFKNDTSLYYDTVHPNLSGYMKMTELLPIDTVSYNTSYQGTVLDFTHTNSLFKDSTTINGTYNEFVFTSTVTVNSTTTSNAHITINFNHSGSTRFLLWDSLNTNKMWFGGIFKSGTINGSNGKSYVDVSYLPISFNLTVLSKNSVQYLFINDNLALSYNNGFTPRGLTIGAEGCGVTFASNSVGHSETTLYTTYSNKVSDTSTGLVAYSITNISNAPSSTLSTITSTTTDTAGTKSTTIVSSASTFLFTGNLTISEIGSNSHVSLSIGTDHSSSYRFLIWDKNSDGIFHFGYGPNYNSSSQGFFNFATKKTLNIAVLSTSKHSYLFVDGCLQTVFTGKGNCTLLYATESMSATLTNGTVYNSSAQLYQTYLDVVTTYENGSYTTGSAIDVGGAVYVSSIAKTMSDFSQSSGNAVTNGVLMQFDSPYFAYETSITVNSKSSNAHISISFDDTANNRFLIWDNDSDGTFNYGGAYGGTPVTGSGSTSASTFTLAIYVYQTKAFMFINGTLTTVLSFSFNVCEFRIGAESCSVSFNNNILCTSIQNSVTYDDYSNKSEVSDYLTSAVGLYDHTNGGKQLV